MSNSDKIILDLCGGTGSWSRPYKEAGDDVRTLTLPEFDVRGHSFMDGRLMITHHGEEHSGVKEICQLKNVYGILAAPPCTMFSFARTNAKKPRDLKEGMECVRACLDIIWGCQEIQQPTSKKTLPLKFWALENPSTGLLKHFLGRPAYYFNPWMFGDSYQKSTVLWGYFNEPTKLTEKPIYHKKLVKFDYMKSKDIHPEAFGKFDRQTRRSITPAGFAQAFYEANK